MELRFRELNSYTKNDFENVRNILFSTWLDTYSKIVPPEDLKAYLDLTCNDNKLKELLNNRLSKGILAEADGKPVGWLRTNIDPVQNKFFINQIYVLKEYQGNGIGTHLIKIAEEEALKNNFDKIWLAVMSENLPSIRWYKSIGFVFNEEAPFKMINSTIIHLLGWKDIKI